MFDQARKGMREVEHRRAAGKLSLRWRAKGESL